jgi:hypothetical protein
VVVGGIDTCSVESAEVEFELAATGGLSVTKLPHLTQILAVERSCASQKAHFIAITAAG